MGNSRASHLRLFFCQPLSESRWRGDTDLKNWWVFRPARLLGRGASGGTFLFSRT